MRLIRMSPQLAYELAVLNQRMNDHALRIDIAYVLAAGDDYGFTQGWPHHKVDPARLSKNWGEGWHDFAKSP